MSVNISQLIKEYFTPEPKKMVFLSQEEFEEWEERAAIMEFDGELPRAEAEKLAWARILRRRNSSECRFNIHKKEK